MENGQGKRRSVFHGILYSRAAANFSNRNASDAPEYDENSSVIQSKGMSKTEEIGGPYI